MINTQVVDFEVSSLCSKNEFRVSEAFIVPHLNVGRRSIEADVDSVNYLRDLNIPALSVSELQILIGVDVQYAHINVD